MADLMELHRVALPARLLRRAIRSGGRAGIAGAAGRWLGRRVGWPLPTGVRIPIENADEYIQRLIVTHGIYEPNVTFVIGNLCTAGRTFVDVGANIGQHTLIAAGRGASVHAFEPLPRLVARLRRAIRLNGLDARVKIEASAVGKTPGEAMLHVARREDDGSHSLLPGVAASSIERVPVTVVTLDSALNRAAFVPQIVKIDVEGFEAAVLDGAYATLHATEKPVWIVETADRLADQLGESAATVVARLQRAGYEIWELPEFDRPQRIDGLVKGHLTNYLATHPAGGLHREVLALLKHLRAA